MLKDNFFKRVEAKTNISKDTILSLASKLQNGNMKDEKVLKEVICELSRMTGKEVDEEKQQIIVDTILSDKVPDNVEKMF